MSMLLLGVVGLVLALCCANVANLVLARGAGRARDGCALRSGLDDAHRCATTHRKPRVGGAGRPGRLVAGALLVNAAQSLIPSNLLPPAVVLGFGSRVAGFSLATSVVIGILFGLVSAWRATSVSLTSSLTAESRTFTAHGGWLRNAIVVGEVAVAVIVLCGAGLLLRTLLVVDGFDTGYGAQRERLLAVTVSVSGLTPGTRYPTRESLLQFYDAIDREVRAIPAYERSGQPPCRSVILRSEGRHSTLLVLRPRKMVYARRPTFRSSPRPTSIRWNCRWSPVVASATMTGSAPHPCASSTRRSHAGTSGPESHRRTHSHRPHRCCRTRDCRRRPPGERASG